MTDSKYATKHEWPAFNADLSKAIEITVTINGNKMTYSSRHPAYDSIMNFISAALETNDIK